MTARFIPAVPLGPLVTGVALFALTRAPISYRQPLLDRLAQYLSPRTVGRAIVALRWLFAITVVRAVHSWLGAIAQNNFRVRSQRHRYQWDRELAIVTGGASGFGALMSKDLAARGVTVVAVDIRDALPPDMEALPRIHYERCDVTDRGSVVELAARVRRRHGDPSVLINNAGIALQHTVLGTGEEALRSVFGVNVMAHWYTCQAFLPAMIEAKKGHVVTIASMASFISTSHMVSYASSKAAVMAFHEGLAHETRTVYDAPDVLFTLVHPTFAATPLISPHRKELNAMGVLVIEPQDVSDAVIKQILSCRGAQLIIAPGTSFISTFRAWPHWLSQGLLRLMDRGSKGHPKAAQEGTDSHASPPKAVDGR